ncbi:hypothetical protein QBC38DRAFT_445963 [Podospora fimiseda]|uniref:Uncharacterized protein n=1 Tax=Podospora fimiseda TaxID=252190 RepID=A0AAN7GR36_9PEZI|nr:hypothetical protein QBC38DRAFT_445963 [Podospora fimiseda]
MFANWWCTNKTQILQLSFLAGSLFLWVDNGGDDGGTIFGSSIAHINSKRLGPFSISWLTAPVLPDHTPGFDQRFSCSRNVLEGFQSYSTLQEPSASHAVPCHVTKRGPRAEVDLSTPRNGIETTFAAFWFFLGNYLCPGLGSTSHKNEGEPAEIHAVLSRAARGKAAHVSPSVVISAMANPASIFQKTQCTHDAGNRICREATSILVLVWT